MDEPDQITSDLRPPQILQPAVADDSAEFETFYREYTPRLVGFLIMQGARAADAVEIVQEVMTKAWQSWSTLRTPSAWAYVTAGRAWTRRNAAIDEDLIAEFPEYSAMFCTDSEIDEWLEHNHYARLVRALPPRQRQVMAWTMEGYDSTQIAKMLHLNPATVRSNLRKARRAIAANAEGGARP